jgi:hypothetical protein
MGYVAVGAALLFWGVLAGRAGRKVGTVLALIPVAVWLGFVAWFGWTDSLDSPAEDALPAYLVIGLLAFFVGSNLASGAGASRSARREQ